MEKKNEQEKKSKKKRYVPDKNGECLSADLRNIAGSINGSLYKRYKVEPNETGRKQFYEYQTNGKYKNERWGYSDNVDPYFFVLREGKHKFDLLCRELQQSFEKGHWWGFHRLWLDWKGDRWLLPYICKWYKKYGDLPEWLDKEEMI